MRRQLSRKPVPARVRMISDGCTTLRPGKVAKKGNRLHWL